MAKLFRFMGGNINLGPEALVEFGQRIELEDADSDDLLARGVSILPDDVFKALFSESDVETYAADRSETPDDFTMRYHEGIGLAMQLNKAARARRAEALSKRNAELIQRTRERSAAAARDAERKAREARKLVEQTLSKIQHPDLVVPTSNTATLKGGAAPSSGGLTVENVSEVKEVKE